MFFGLIPSSFLHIPSIPSAPIDTGYRGFPLNIASNFIPHRTITRLRTSFSPLHIVASISHPLFIALHPLFIIFASSSSTILFWPSTILCRSCTMYTLQKCQLFARSLDSASLKSRCNYRLKNSWKFLLLLVTITFDPLLIDWPGNIEEDSTFGEPRFLRRCKNHYEYHVIV